ncbi:MAG: hypothetical protein QW035_04085 [Candidatus Anstonellales archaeon]
MGRAEDKLREMLMDKYGIRMEETLLFEKGAVKIMSKRVAKLNIKGAERGMVASNEWMVPSHSFIQLVGREAKKGFVELGKEEALLFASGKKIKKEAAKGHLIAIYKGHSMGICFSNGKELMPKLAPRKQRRLIGDIKNRFLK